MQSFAAHERIALLQVRLMEAAKAVSNHDKRKYTTLMKELFDECLITYFSEDLGRRVVGLRGVGYRLRWSTISYPRP